MKAAILTYHSQNIAGNDTSNNDHVALAADLEGLHSAGYRFVSLDGLIKAVFEDGSPHSDQPLIALTFDDGCVFDVQTLEFPGHSLQTGFLQIMENFITRHGIEAQAGLHATSFVIASPEARQRIDEKSLFGLGHINDEWWFDADRHPLLSIGNHGWDHNHPDLEEEDYARGSFEVINTRDRSFQQVVHAGEYIGSKTGRYPDFFAYPFGESSEYIRDQYFPLQGEEHRCQAAFGTHATLLNKKSDRWNLPRFVCGRDWSCTAELLNRLSG